MSQICPTAMLLGKFRTESPPVLFLDPVSVLLDDITWGRYHGGRRPSSDDSFHSPTVIPPSARDKPSINLAMNQICVRECVSQFARM